ncbi:MAG: RNA polymerase-binding protein RbpA, partial [Actinobacteria bacterium]|nr:RNA polymerase-binding protein RbpA [Actinomycetota bacterium]
MADRVLRGSRLGAISYETEYAAEPAPRQLIRFRCE